MNPTQNVEELYARIAGVVAGVVGGTNYVSNTQDSPLLAAHLPWVQAWFSPQTRLVNVNPALTRRFNTFFHTTSSPRRSLSPDEAAERWALGLVKTDLEAVTAAALRGIGPQDENLMRMEWDSHWQFPHGHTVANGVPEALAARIVNQVARELGFIERDPRFADVQPLQSRYVTQAGIVESVAADVADGRGSTVAAELIGMVRAGSGHLALWSLARRFGGSSEFGQSPAFDKPIGWVEFRQALDSGLAGVAADWASGQDGVDADLDDRSDTYWFRVVSRDVRSAARRVKAGPGGIIDVPKLGKAISAAAEQAHAEVDTKMDFLQAAWMAAEDVGGVEA